VSCEGRLKTKLTLDKSWLKRVAIFSALYVVLSLVCVAASKLESQLERFDEAIQTIVVIALLLCGPGVNLFAAPELLGLYAFETVLIFVLASLCLRLNSSVQSLELVVGAWIGFGIVWMACGLLPLVFIVS
jgi:hypothetical protein